MVDILSQRLKIAIVGDIHEQWEPADHSALLALGVDLVLFVGDFGNESLTVVQQIATLPLPKASVFGNHDAWYTASDWGRKKAPYDHCQEDRVQAQRELLGDIEVSYRRRDFDQWGFSVVGARPFTWGGGQWKNKAFLQERYGIASFTESQALIESQALASPHDTLIFLGHNGPTGLGADPESICGRDWKPLGGDFGDPDFATAIDSVRQQGKQIPLVTFGHMHHRLRHRQDRLRERIIIDEHGTVYLNAANVPRITGTGANQSRNFALVEWVDNTVERAELLWVRATGQITEREILFEHRAKINAG